METLKKYKHYIFTFLALLCIALVIKNLDSVDFTSISRSLSSFSGQTLTIALALSLLQVISQGLRLHRVLPFKIRILDTVRSVAQGQVINQIVPARGGDVAKIYLLQKNSLSQKGSTHEALGSVFFNDKIIDISALLILALIGGPTLLNELQKLLPDQLGWAIVATAIILFFFIFKIPKVKTHAAKVFSAVSHLKNPAIITSGVLLASVHWIAEALTLVLLTKGLGFEIDFFQGLWVLIVLNVGIAVPITTGNVGIFEAALVFALSRIDVDTSPALAIAIVHHILQVISPIIIAAGLTAIHKLQGTET